MAVGSLMTSSLPHQSFTSPSLFALLCFLFFLPPSPCNFFVQRIKFHLRGLWERRPRIGPCPYRCFEFMGLWCLQSRRSGEGRDGAAERRDWRGVEALAMLLLAVGEGETCLYFLGIRRQMGALKGGLRSQPPWMAGKLTPSWLCGLCPHSPPARGQDGSEAFVGQWDWPFVTVFHQTWGLQLKIRRESGSSLQPKALTETLKIDFFYLGLNNWIYDLGFISLF